MLFGSKFYSQSPLLTEKQLFLVEKTLSSGDFLPLLTILPSNAPNKTGHPPSLNSRPAAHPSSLIAHRSSLIAHQPLAS